MDALVTKLIPIRAIKAAQQIKAIKAAQQIRTIKERLLISPPQQLAAIRLAK